MGVYAQADFHLTDKLTVTGGLRYSVDDKKDSAVNGVYSSGDAENPAPGATFTCGLPTCPLPLKGSFNGVSYTFGLDYRFTPDIMGYVKTAKGFRAGGVNLRANPVFPQTLLAFQPETATSYEGGVKSEFFDRHLRVNLAGYYTIDENIQRVALFSLGNQTASAIVNAGRADFYGFEAEASVVLPQGLRLDGTLSYVHPKYVRYAPTGFDQSRERFQNVTPWTASISPSWSQEIGQAKVLLRGDFIYQSKSPLYTYNVYSCGAGLLCDASSGSQVSAADAAGYIDSSTDPAHWLINARGSISFMNDKYELAVWGKNLTNKRDNIVGLPIAPLGETANIKREPRSFGVTATVKFSQH
jgi:iron complex outermembrane recepter protein